MSFLKLNDKKVYMTLEDGTVLPVGDPSEINLSDKTLTINVPAEKYIKLIEELEKEDEILSEKVHSLCYGNMTYDSALTYLKERYHIINVIR